MSENKAPSPLLRDLIASLQQWSRQSITLKLAVLGFLSLLMAIPLTLVEGLVRERKNRKEAVIRQMSEQWATTQQVVGPVLNVPYRDRYRDKYGNIMTNIATAHFLPHSLDISGQVSPQTRYRGIYRAIVYSSKLQLHGTFQHPSFLHWEISNTDILWDKAYISIGLSDVKGLSQKVLLHWNQKQSSFGPGIRSFDLSSSGISCSVPLNNSSKRYAFSIELHLKGTNSLTFVPLGTETKVALRSSWASPNFIGSFLPLSRKIGTHGFSAQWKVFDMNRNFPQRWRQRSYHVASTNLGVQLFQGTQSYQKSHRILKYSMVFLGCILLLLFFVEMLSQERLHIVHYGLFGLALCIFYLLQLALSEHIGFNLSYLIAAGVCVALLFAYARWVCRGKGVPWLLGVIAGSLHLLFFAMLQLEDYALLLGTGVSLVVLVVVMNLSARLRLTSDTAANAPKGGALAVEARNTEHIVKE